MFDWDTNTIVPGDTLSQIALECNKRYGTDYTADDLQDLNSDTISDKDKIFAGNHLNLGIAENVQKRAADYVNRATIQYSNNQVTTPKKDTHIRDGIIEITIGCIVIAGGLYSANQLIKKNPAEFIKTESMAGYGAFTVSGTILALGIGRLTGKNKNSVESECKNIIEPAIGSALEVYNDSKRSKGRTIDFNKKDGN